MTATLTEVTVNVTRDHIADGEPGECATCPIALALLDAMPGVREAAVHYDDVHEIAGATLHLRKGSVLSIALPPAAASFIFAYDNGEEVTPFTFTAKVLS